MTNNDKPDLYTARRDERDAALLGFAVEVLYSTLWPLPDFDRARLIEAARNAGPHTGIPGMFEEYAVLLEQQPDPGNGYDR